MLEKGELGGGGELGGKGERQPGALLRSWAPPGTGFELGSATPCGQTPCASPALFAL